MAACTAGGEEDCFSFMAIITWECTVGSTVRGSRYWIQRMMMVKVFFM